MRLACFTTVLFAALAVAEAPKAPPAPAKSVDVILDGLKSSTPSTWVQEKPANNLRPYQFRLPHANGDKNDAVLFVLDTIRGTPEENIANWKDVFILPANMPKDKSVRRFEIKNAKATLTCLDVQGTYHVKDKPIDQAVKEVRPDYRLIGAVWVSKDARLTIRLIGPKTTVEGHAKAFEQWLRNFK